MWREEVEVRNIKDGTRDRSPPFRRPGREVGEGVEGAEMEVRAGRRRS